MKKSSTKPSLGSLSRADILRLCEKYEGDKPQLRRLLLRLFSKRENIHLFGWFVNRDYVHLETPDFHKKIYDTISNTSLSMIGIGAPRGHAKSTTIDFVYPLWSACYNYHHFCPIISDTYTQSVEFVNALKDQFENNVVLRWLFGDLTSDLWRDGEFVLQTGIKFIAMGAGMKVRGIRFGPYRPDLVIVDDLENDESVSSAEQRRKLKSWFTKALLPALSKDGRIIMIGTILHHDSLLNNVLKQSEMFAAWSVLKYTAIYLDNDGVEHALWPAHMSLEYLRAIRDDPKHPKFIGSIAFAQEYQQKPFDEDSALVKPDWVKWCEIEEVPGDERIVATALAADPAAGQKQTNDPTGMVYAKLSADGNLYVCAINNARQSPQSTAKTIKDWDIVYAPMMVGVEDGTLGLVFREMLAGLPVVGLKPDKDKVRRLLAVLRFFEAGKIYIVKGIRNAQALYDQLIEFPSGSHDDLVDALVYVIRMLLVDGVDRDEDAATAGSYRQREASASDDDDEEEWEDDDVAGAY